MELAPKGAASFCGRLLISGDPVFDLPSPVNRVDYTLRPGSWPCFRTRASAGSPSSAVVRAGGDRSTWVELVVAIPGPWKGQPGDLRLQKGVKCGVIPRVLSRRPGPADGAAAPEPAIASQAYPATSLEQVLHLVGRSPIARRPAPADGQQPSATRRSVRPLRPAICLRPYRTAKPCSRSCRTGRGTWARWSACCSSD